MCLSGRANIYMRSHLQVALMATTVAAATFLSTASVWAESAGRTIATTTDEFGRKIYVNDEGTPKSASARDMPQPAGLSYWSSTEHRWKAVPRSGATIPLP